MNGHTVLYVDSSALVKLLVAEPETPALRSRTAHSAVVASALVLVEVPRAVARHGIPPDAPAVGTLLGGLRLLQVEPAVLGVAALLQPPALRSLDAVHLASALSIRDRLDGFVAYDVRLLDAARDLGLPVLTPGGAL